MKILVMGGTRFVGKRLIERLELEKHEITVFTRGIMPVPQIHEHIKGDRSTNEGLRLLQGRTFDVIIDSSGRKLVDTQRVLEATGLPSYRFLYVSSAGVYADSQQWPIDEKHSTDPLSRHFGKAETESWLAEAGVPFTSFRPTYIYGPGNYNPIEKWFFDRILNNRVIPLPNDGSSITQLGHVSDLAEAMARSLLFDCAKNQIYNCSDKKGITFLGLINAAAFACGKDPSEVETRSFDPSSLDLKARKYFPLRLGHFLTDVSRLENDLDWEPEFDIEKGLLDSFQNDYSLNRSQISDFNSDSELIGILDT